MNLANYLADVPPYLFFILIAIGLGARYLTMKMDDSDAEKEAKRREGHTGGAVRDVYTTRKDYESEDSIVTDATTETPETKPISAEQIEAAYKDIKNDLQQLGNQRKWIALAGNLMWGFYSVILIALSIIYIYNFAGRPIPFIPADFRSPFLYYGILLLIVAIYPLSRFFINSTSKFLFSEMRAISTLIHTLFPSFNFTVQENVSWNILKASQLFSRINGEIPLKTYGLMTGKHKGVRIQISDIGLAERTKANSIIDLLARVPLLNIPIIFYKYVGKNIHLKQTSNSSLYTFRGMFCQARFNRKLAGKTIIIPNTFGDRYERFVNFSSKWTEKVLLEDPRFTDKFMVYGTDQIEARYILTSTMMEKINQFQQKHNRPHMVSFVDDKIYIAVENPDGIFAFSAGKLNSSAVVQELVDDVSTALSVVENFEMSR